MILRRARVGVGAVVLAGMAVATGSASASGHLARNAAAGDIVQVPVSFTVHNTNTTSVACLSDGKAYTIRGHITAQRKDLVHPTAATLYLHAVTQGEFYWNFDAVPGYDVARTMAAAGHVAVTIDRLGYGASDKPPGLGSCFGSQADTAHQVVQALRTGRYTSSVTPVAFPKVFTTGHSAGGLVGTIEAYTYKDVAGFVDFGWSDTTTSAFLTTQLSETEGRCVKSAIGMGTPGNRPDYEAFGNDPAGILFYSASPAVRRAVPRPNADPCGDLLSIPAALQADAVGVPLTTAPVLLIGGAKDALFPAPDMQLQAQRYTQAQDVTFVQLAETAHGFNYEASHAAGLQVVARWLSSHGG